MTKLTTNAKGQVTLKQELLEHVGVAPGEKIEADKLPDGRIVVWADAHEGTETRRVWAGVKSEPVDVTVRFRQL